MDQDKREVSMTGRSGMAGEGAEGAAGHPPLDIEALVRRHHADVYRYAFRLCGAEADAEDLVQQTFLLAQQRLQQVRHPERVLGWLRAITRTSYLKGRRKRLPVTATAMELNVDEIPEESEDAEVDSQLVQAAVDDLPDDFKTVLLMFYFEGCSYKEIAAQLEMPVGTVMSKLSRAKGRLRGRVLARQRKEHGMVAGADRDDGKSEEEVRTSFAVDRPSQTTR